MTDPELRESRSLTPAFLRTEPIAPSIPLELVKDAPAISASGGKVFTADGLDGQDALGIGPLVSVISQLATHKNADSPFCIGILGAPGTGKSFALARFAKAVEVLTGRAAAQKDTPYLANVQIIHADAARLDGEPMTALADALCGALGRTVPDLVEEALRAVRDPHAAVKDAAERLDEAQRRLRLERDNLTEVEGRRARLFDSLLYETPGSQVDAYVRTYRPRIASRLQAFGFSGDPILNYKDLVASLAAAQGSAGRIGLAFRTLWAFKGQTRLLVIALALALVGLGLGWAVAHQTTWLEPLRANQTGAPIASWFQAHMSLVTGLGQAAFAGAGLALAANLWRAFRFLQPVLRGVTLLKTELTNRKHELDSTYAHQTRRVDGLAAEVERAARLHAEADQHAGKAEGVYTKDSSPFRAIGEKPLALHFARTLSGLLAQKNQQANAGRTIPQRVLVLLDNLDGVSAARSLELLDAAHRLLTLPNFVTVITLDPEHLAQVGQGSAARLEKWVQVPVRIDAAAKDRGAFITQFVAQARRGELAEPSTELIAFDPRHSQLDQPLSEEEARLLAELAPLAGNSARALKRFVNLYRLTRSLVPEHWASLAFMLALEGGGTASEVEAIANALAVAKPGADLDLSQGHPRLSELLAAVRRVESGPTAEAAKQVAPIAATFSFRA